MGIIGCLDTMSLEDLLNWASNSQKTGCLKITQGKNVTQFFFQRGRIAGSASNDPPTLLGQFLISRGKITEEQLQRALTAQEHSGRSLGAILVDSRTMGEAELNGYLVAKAEESLLGLFDTAEALFEFDSQAEEPIPGMVPLQLEVGDLIERSRKRRVEMERIQSVFHDTGIVLSLAGEELPEEITKSPVASRICAAIDGRRTVAEILLHARASEFLALKLLYELRRMGLVCIDEIRNQGPAAGSPESACAVAEKMIERGEIDTAIDFLRTATQAHPDSGMVWERLGQAEAAFVEQAYQNVLPPNAIPVQLPSPDRQVSDMTPNEAYVFDLLESKNWKVKQLVQIAPMHEYDVVCALKGLVDRGYIELQPTETLSSTEATQDQIKNFLSELHAQTDIDSSLDDLLGSKGAKTPERDAELSLAGE